VDVETLPLLVADWIIATQEIVCQEKNAILEIFIPPLGKF
jgi:hypothetical protein